MMYSRTTAGGLPETCRCCSFQQNRPNEEKYSAGNLPWWFSSGSQAVPHSIFSSLEATFKDLNNKHRQSNQVAPCCIREPKTITVCQEKCNSVILRNKETTAVKVR